MKLRVRTLSAIVLLVISMILPMMMATRADKELILEGYEISRWEPSAIPADEPSYLIGGWGWIEALPDKSEHKYLGGADMRVTIDGQEIKLLPTRDKEDFLREWYAQFEPNHFSLGEHTIKTVWYQRHDIAGTVDTTFTVYDEDALIWMYGPRVRSNLVYNTEDPEDMDYRLIFSVKVAGVENYDEIDYVKVTYPDPYGTTVDLRDEGYGWGYHEADDGEYFEVVDIDYQITGDFTFTVADTEGKMDQITANLDEWLPAFDSVSPSWGEVVDISETSLILEWEYTEQYSLRPFALRLGNEGTEGGDYFWQAFAAEPPYIYGYLEPGVYWHGIFAETSDGNSIHAFTNFEIIE